MKKRYIFLFLLICVAFVIFTTKIFAQTNALLIYVDPGHGGVDGGATVGNVKESTLTLEISKRIKEIFEKNSIQVILTRENDDDLSSDPFVKREDMLKRVNKINTSNAAIALSIHLNKFSIEKYRGAQVFYSKTNTSNQLLAEAMQKSLCTYLKNTERNIVKRDNIFLLNKVTIPCCIIECGFMSNTEEFRLLQSEEYQYKIAYALLYGIEDYLKLY